MCEPWVIKVFWRSSGGGITENVRFYKTLESAERAAEYFKYCISVDHYQGPAYVPHWAEEREKSILKRMIQDIEQGVISVWEY